MFFGSHDDIRSVMAALRKRFGAVRPLNSNFSGLPSGLGSRSSEGYRSEGAIFEVKWNNWHWKVDTSSRPFICLILRDRTGNSMTISEQRIEISRYTFGREWNDPNVSVDMCSCKLHYSERDLASGARSFFETEVRCRYEATFVRGYAIAAPPGIEGPGASIIVGLHVHSPKQVNGNKEMRIGTVSVCSFRVSCFKAKCTERMIDFAYV